MNDVKGSIMKITNTIAKTSGDLFKSTKISLSLSAEEERLKAIYLDIGKKVHEIYQYGGSLGKAFDEKYAEIVKQEDKIQKLRQQIEIIKGTKACPKCSAVMDKNAEFCSKCGYKAGASEASLPDTVTPTSDTPINVDNSDVPETETIEMSGIETNYPEPETITLFPKKMCRACGKEVENNDKFCLYCGRML